MAKGNDGNYLQHSVEVATAVHLAAKHREGRLHIALAHGMAPFEPCGELPSGQARAQLRDVLHAAQQPPTVGESPVVAAYRPAKASLDHYPNTGELLRRVIGSDRLSDGITEVDSQKYAQLRQVWSGSRVTPVRSSWLLALTPNVTALLEFTVRDQPAGRQERVASRQDLGRLRRPRLPQP